jgi:hypothetical protein
MNGNDISVLTNAPGSRIEEFPGLSLIRILSVDLKFRNEWSVLGLRSFWPEQKSSKIVL